MFRCVKTFSSRVIVQPFPYLTITQMLAVNVTLQPKIYQSAELGDISAHIFLVKLAITSPLVPWVWFYGGPWQTQTVYQI